MKLESVVVSVDYADILAYTLPQNSRYFDRMVVVTSSRDRDTKRLCEIYGVKCVVTDLFYEGAVFNKAAGINEGLKHLDKDGWVLHMDGDIWLHPQSVRELRALKLNSQNLYGCDRVMIESYEQWLRFLSMPDLYREDWLIRLSEYKVGSRITQYWDGGHWQVLGFFQLWHPSSSGVFDYPDSNDASKSDILFSQKWSRSRRVLIPEVMAIHLENQESQTGTNWGGRRTKKFNFS